MSVTIQSTSAVILNADFASFAIQDPIIFLQIIENGILDRKHLGFIGPYGHEFQMQRPG
ncbi:MAG: hypothetical protein ABFQ95_05810 [Pseudomonadota bacterium]